MMPTTLLADAARHLPEMVRVRRAIHAEPELGLHNPLTAGKIRAALEGLPLKWRESQESSGLVAILDGAADGPSVLLRADTDALPMIEQTGLAFTSRHPGIMHACGHDGHTAMLIGAARMLCARQPRLKGRIMFMFQPGEEGHHGARVMLDEGLIEPLPEAAFALHIMPNAPYGSLSSRAGPLMASTDRLRIRVLGRGGHASLPHEAADPIPVACEIVGAIQSLVTRTVSVTDPAVVTIAKIEAGTSDTIIPDWAFLLGTIRTLSPDRRAKLHDSLIRLANGIAGAHGLDAEVEIEPGFPVTWNNMGAVKLGQQVAIGEFGAAAWKDLDHPVMGGEDFSYILQRIPGAMFFLGGASEGEDWTRCCGLHSTSMSFDESVMARGAAFLSALALTYLACNLK